MKKTRLLSLILVLVLLLSALPLSALAAEVTLKDYDSAHHTSYDGGPYSHQVFVFGDDRVYVQDGVIYKVSDNLKDKFPVGSIVLDGSGGPHYFHAGHIHSFSFRITRTGHGMACKCGTWQLQLAHDDPLTAKDGKCHCGYEYMDNTQITVIWMRNVALSPKFYKDKYEYTGKLLKDVDELSLVTVKLFDEMATLEAPENYKLKPGTNTFEFKVTAEDKKTTQTYTITIEK